MAARLPVDPEFSRIPRHAWIGKTGDLAIVFTFALLISLPLVLFWITPQQASSTVENRVMAPRPRLDVNHIQRLPKEIERYYNDHFGLREFLVHSDSVLRYKWFGLSGARLVIGRDRWAFFAGDGMFENHLGLDQFSPQELTGWLNYLESRQALAASRGARYVFVVAPDKASIYPEMLPRSLRPNGARSRLDQLLTFIQKCQSSAPVFDLRGPLIDAKKTGIVYYPQDTHWNGRGYYAAYFALCNYLKQYYPALPVAQLGRDYEIKRVSWGVGNWSLAGLPEENLAFPSDFLFPLRPSSARVEAIEPPPSVTAIRDPDHALMGFQNEKGLLRALIFHDSFIYTGIPERNQTPFRDTFAQSAYLGAYPSDAQFQALLDQEKPDIVIEERVERFVSGVPAR